MSAISVVQKGRGLTQLATTDVRHNY